MKFNGGQGKRRFVVIMLSVFTVVALISTLWINSLLAAKDSSSKEDVVVTIARGQSTNSIANTLNNNGLIKSKEAFVYYARFKGLADKLKVGEYTVNPAMSVAEIVEKLVNGKVVTISFTIPEGYDLKQIAAVLKSKGLINEDKYWELVKEGDFEYSFLKDLPKTEKRFEGYLFPDTYSIPKGYTEKQILNMMLKRFQEVWEQLPGDKTKMSVHELITLASIVEMEAQVDEERPLVASVFLNRLKINMALESCATIQYALPQRVERVLYKDLEIKSPYNTYINPGLPPGPIGSPGKASLNAVLNPAESNYYFFLAKLDSSGTHVFSKTLTEHNKNKNKLGYFDR